MRELAAPPKGNGMAGTTTSNSRPAAAQPHRPTETSQGNGVGHDQSMAQQAGQGKKSERERNDRVKNSFHGNCRDMVSHVDKYFGDKEIRWIRARYGDGLSFMASLRLDFLSASDGRKANVIASILMAPKTPMRD